MWICPECRSVYRDAVETCERDDVPVAEVQAHQTKGRYPLLGKVVGDRYHLIGGLGQGGLGTVYLAQHLHLSQLFAVKFLDLETLGPDLGEKQQKDEYRRDFLKEARVASLIRHEAVVRVSDFGEHDGMPFLVMEYVPGPSLLQVLGTKGRFAVPEALAISRRIAEALDAFHERRLVHRDLKPANVILDPRANGRLTLVDLGLVKDLSGPGGKASTHPLALRGTPGYLAPEQVPGWVLSGAGIAASGREKMIDARVDIYALGVILYEMIGGVSPYPAELSNTQIIVYACTRDPLPIDQVDPPPKLMPGLQKLVYDTMNRDPERRPQTAADFLERLDEVTMGAALSGSWPSIVVPRQPLGISRPSGLLGPSGPPRAAPPPAASPHGLIDLDASENLEPTAVFDQEDALSPPPAAVAPVSGAVPYPLVSAAEEDRTLEADVDSFDGLMGAVDDFDEEARTQVQPDRLSSVTQVASIDRAPSEPKGRRPSLALALLPLLVGLAAGAWYFTRDRDPDVSGVRGLGAHAAADANTEPVRVTFNTEPDTGARRADVAQVVAVEADAGSPPLDAAAPSVDAARSVPEAKPEKPRKTRRRRTARAPSAAHFKAQGDRSFQDSMNVVGAKKKAAYRQALRHYRKYVSAAGTVEPQVSSRIQFLERELAK